MVNEVSICYRKGYKPSLEQQKQDAKQVADFVKEIIAEKEERLPKRDVNPILPF